MEKTLVIIKPDGVKKNIIGQIVSRYEAKDLVVNDMKMIKATIETLKLHYEEHIGKPYFDGLMTYMTCGPVVLMSLSGDNAIEAVRRINGATDPKVAEKGSIRFDFAESKTKNIVHGSDSSESANREIAIWFK